MGEDLMLKCLIAFILGWLVSRMMGNGFSVGGQVDINTCKLQLLSKTQSKDPDINKYTTCAYSNLNDNDITSICNNNTIYNETMETFNEAELVDELKVDTNLYYLWDIASDLIEGRIITLPPWLQRQLQENEWTENDNDKAKSYFASAIKGTLKFETFTLVPVTLLVKKLTGLLKHFTDSEQIEELKKAIVDIKSYPKAESVILDGQSRGFLSIIK